MAHQVPTRPGLTSESDQHLNIYSAIAANRWRTALLVAIFVGLVGLLGYALGEIWAQGAGLLVLPLALVLASLLALGSYFRGDRVVLNISHAREVDEIEEPVLHHLVEALATGAGVPKPRLYVIDDRAPNAFSTGRDPQHASIAVTSGLLATMDRTELEGVLAHELSHVRNYDIRVMLIVAVLLGMAALLSDFLLRSMWLSGGRRGRSRDRSGGLIILLVIGVVLAIIAPILAQIVRFAISRQREYLADASGALLTRYPAGLASALRKIEADQHPLAVANRGTAALYITNPLGKAPRALDRLFDTHPPIEERIERLEAM
jgi:heat shock protein HtpX